MYITLESDYAVRIISCLALENRRLDAKTISDKTKVTVRFALKILRKLVAGGIVKSYKGTQGGYQLAGKPSEITLKDVIEAIEGTYSFSRCLDPDYECTRGMSGVCCYQRAFSEISYNVRKQLESYNFENMLKLQKSIDDGLTAAGAEESCKETVCPKGL